MQNLAYKIEVPPETLESNGHTTKSESSSDVCAACGEPLFGPGAELALGRHGEPSGKSWGRTTSSWCAAPAASTCRSYSKLATSRPLMETLAKLALSANFEALGLLTLRYGLVLILFWIGAMKFTAFEAAAIQPLIDTSPLINWLYRVFDVQSLSNLLGMTEITASIMIALGPYSAKLAALGSAFSILIFLTTFSFLFSLPGWEPSLGGFPALSSAGGFLLKDICLLGIALWSLGEAAGAIIHPAEPKIIAQAAARAAVRR